MGRLPSSEHDLVGPRLWARFLKRHFKCADLGPLNAQLALRVTEGETFSFGTEPVPLPSRVRPRLFERAYDLGRNPDGNYCLELDDEDSRFNLFARVSQRVPPSEPWLLKDLRPYMLDDLPPVDQSCSLLQRSLAELDLMLVDVGPLDGWEKVDPVGASQAEQGSFRALSKSALPQSLALLFAIAHVATWRRPPLLHQPPSKIITTAYDAVDQFASSLHRRGFSDADMIGGIVGRVLHSAVANIHYWGARTMPAGAMEEFPRLGDRIVLLPRTDGMKSALRKLHTVGIYGVEMLLKSIRDGRSTEFRQEELEIAASSLLSGSLSAQESLLEQADALFS